MLWIKVIHICFVVFWYAGLLYLPRLFVNYSETQNSEIRAHLLGMQQRLYRRIMHLTAVGSLVSGLVLLGYMPHALRDGWLIVKLALVGILTVYHFYLGYCIRQYERGAVPHSGKFLRIFNEVPALLLIAIAVMVVVKPWTA